MIIRMQPEHIPIVSELGQEMHSEGRYSKIPFNLFIYQTYLRLLLDNPDFRGFLYRSSQGEIAGYLLGLIAPFEFSDELRAVDLGYYVSTHNRGGPAAVRLEAAYSKWALENRVKKHNIYLACSNGHNKTEQFFKKMRYNYVGSIFSKGE